MHSINIQPESEVRGSLPLINHEPKGPGVISGKILMIEGEGHMFVEYTIVAVVHMIYTMGMSQ